MSIEWRNIPGYEDLYQVSNTGLVKKLTRKTANLNQKRTDNGQGYYTVRLTKNRKSRNCRVHRLVAEAFIPNPFNKPEINHKNCDKTDNSAGNLEWCTTKENHHHAAINGLTTQGEKNYNAKLNAFQVRVIRKCPDLTQLELAEIFNVTSPTVNQIVLRKRWKHVL
jgi:DNA-binding transcriptional regulator YiaG